MLMFDALRSLLVGSIVLAWWLWPIDGRSRFARHVMRPDSSRDSLRLRIVAAFLFAHSIVTQPAIAYAGLPESLVEPLPGWSWLVRLGYPPGVAIVRAGVTMSWLCLPLLIWKRTARVAAVVALVLGTFILGVPQFYGKVNHWHFVLWLLALVAMAPSPERTLFPGASSVRLSHLLFAAVYFYPGVGKLVDDGLAWFSPTQFVGHLHSTWFALGRLEPVVRVDGWAPPILAMLAAYGVLFELAYPFVLGLRKYWRLAPLSSVSFHLATAVTMGISFWPLAFAHVLFLSEREPERGVGGPTPRLRTWAPYALLMVPIMVIGGMGKVSAWPVACFPKFTGGAPSEIAIMTVVGRDAAGRPHDLPFAWFTEPFDRTRFPWLVRRITNAPTEALADTRRRAFAESIPALIRTRTEPRAAELVAFELWSTHYSVQPDRWHESIRRELVYATYPVPTTSCQFPSCP